MKHHSYLDRNISLSYPITAVYYIRSSNCPLLLRLRLTFTALLIAGGEFPSCLTLLSTSIAAPVAVLFSCEARKYDSFTWGSPALDLRWILSAESPEPIKISSCECRRCSSLAADSAISRWLAATSSMLIAVTRRFFDFWFLVSVMDCALAVIALLRALTNRCCGRLPRWRQQYWTWVDVKCCAINCLFGSLFVLVPTYAWSWASLEPGF